MAPYFEDFLKTILGKILPMSSYFEKILANFGKILPVSPYFEDFFLAILGKILPMSSYFEEFCSYFGEYSAHVSLF